MALSEISFRSRVATSSTAVLSSVEAYQAPSSGPEKRRPLGEPCRKDAMMTLALGLP